MQIGLAVKKFQGTERFHMTTRGHIGVQKNETAAILVFQNQSFLRWTTLSFDPKKLA